MVFSSGALRPALAASIALPTVMRPVVVDDRVLIDGGATNPLPFDQLRGRADVIVAVDISGEPTDERRDIPNPWECLFATILVMGSAIIAEKLKHGAPDLIVRPKVGFFRTLDFLQASAILRASEPVKAELKEKLAALLRSRMERSEMRWHLAHGTNRFRTRYAQMRDLLRSPSGLRSIASGQRTSQRLESSSAAGLRLIQLAAAK